MKLNIKISSGGSFDNKRRTPKQIQGPASQVVIHLPSSLRTIGVPIVKINGITQSEQMVHNLLKIGTVALTLTSGVVPLAGGLKELITKLLDKLAGDFLVHTAYSKYRPSTTIQVNEEVNFGESSIVNEIAWVLGGFKKRDISSATSAELTLYLRFEQEGNYDMSMFFNIWGTHSYTSPGEVTMHLENLVLHSFRQHLVINMEVNDNINQEFAAFIPSTFVDPRDGKTYKIVKIGNRDWMAENLNYAECTKRTFRGYRPDVSDFPDGGCLCYNNDLKNCEKHGRLYNYNLARTICPAGWRLPTKQEFNDLIQQANTQPSGLEALLEGGSSGFDASLSGVHGYFSGFAHIGERASWWSDTGVHTLTANHGYWETTNLQLIEGFDAFAISVRCVKKNN